MNLVTLKKRHEFLRVRGGRRCQNVAFLLESKPRPKLAGHPNNSTEHDFHRPPGRLPPRVGDKSALAPIDGPRFGFTITKRLGNAVTRNRIRRRLKHAIAELAPEFARSGHDYVIVARRRAATLPYGDLKKGLERCFERVHDARDHNRSGVTI